MISTTGFKYIIRLSSNFKSDYKKMLKQGKDISKLKKVIEKLANGEVLERQYKEHQLINNKIYKNCYECHLEPDWLLIYKYSNDNLILYLVNTGSHSNLFKK